MRKTDIGIIGLAVMGRSLALNMADHGFQVGGYNRSKEVTEAVIKEHPHKNLIPFYTLKDLVGSQERPRKFMMMVKAGRPVDAVIAQLEPLLEEGDILIDGGNSFFEDTRRRTEALGKKGITISALVFPAGKRGRVSVRPLCRGGMPGLTGRSRPFWRRSPQRPRVSPAAHTWDRTVQAIM